MSKNINVLNEVTLDQLKVSDIDHLTTLANNINIWNNVRDYFPNPYTIEDAISYFELVNKQEPIWSFAIRFKNQFCGIISAEPQSDVYRFSCEMGYWIGEPFWGKNIVSSAIMLMVDYAFSSLKMNRIYASAFEHNIASQKVLEKNGFKLECIKEKAVYKNEKFINEYSYSLVKTY